MTHPYRTPWYPARPPRDSRAWIYGLLLSIASGGLTGVTATLIGVSAYECAGAQHPRTWVEDAHIALASAAHAVALADSIAARQYDRDARDAGSLDALEQRYVNALRSLRFARATLVSAEIAVDAARDSRERGDKCHAALLVVDSVNAMRSLSTDLRDAGVAVPIEIDTALSLVESVDHQLAPSCTMDAEAGHD